MICLSPEKEAVLKTDGHLLIQGGPGSGKSTIALLKAQEIARSGKLKVCQKTLFLSFARTTISHLIEQAQALISESDLKCLEVSTYHAFAWEILKNHGYLINKNRLRILAPHEAAVQFSGLNEQDKQKKMEEQFDDKGMIYFDLFALKCTQLLTGSSALRKIICDVYPFIILDEFQDTNNDEWELLSILGMNSTLIALADPDQRIYGFRGADPARIEMFMRKFKPCMFDFGAENNRSYGTDIIQFGNDLLLGLNKGREYNNVKCILYQPYYNVISKHCEMKCCVLKACARLKRGNPEKWSLAVLVPSNDLMIEVSDYLSSEQKFSGGSVLPPISHYVAIDTAGPSLAAILVAYVLESGSTGQCSLKGVLRRLCDHICGRNGIKAPCKADSELVTSLLAFLENGNLRGKNRQTLKNGCENLVVQSNQMQFSGNIISDWKEVHRLFSKFSDAHLLKVYSDARYLRLLNKGSQLFTGLNSIWKQNACYTGAVEVVSKALTQDHFDLSTNEWNGVNVMTIHKSKGKEFDEVILYEGVFNGKFVPYVPKIEDATLSLRVGITRAKKNTFILTPKHDSCILLC